MSEYHQSYSEAVNIIRNARPSVNINAGFEMQLRQFELCNCNPYLAQRTAVTMAQGLNPARHKIPKKSIVIHNDILDKLSLTRDFKNNRSAYLDNDPITFTGTGSKLYY